MAQNVADLTKALETLEQRSYPIKSEDIEHLSAYITEHIQRFGDYALKMRPLAPLQNKEGVSLPEAHSKDDEASEEMSA